MLANIFKKKYFATFLFAATGTFAHAADEYEYFTNWDRQTSAGGAFNIEFLNAGAVSGNATAERDWTAAEKAVALKACKTLEDTFLNAPAQPIEVRLYIFGNQGSYGAVSNVQLLITPDYNGPNLQNPASTAANFDTWFEEGNVSTIEYIWKYEQKYSGSKASEGEYMVNGVPLGVARVNAGDIRIGFVPEFFTQAGYSEKMLEGTILHELAHGFGFAVPSHDDTAIMNFAKTERAPSGTYDIGYLRGEKAVEVCGEKGVRVAEGTNAPDFSHIIHTPESEGGDVMLPTVPVDPAVAFSNAELAVLQDMGWKIDPQAWNYFRGLEDPETPSNVPEPSLFGIFAGTFVLALTATTRCRRKKT